MHTTTESDLLIKLHENCDCWVGMNQRRTRMFWISDRGKTNWKPKG